MNRDWFDFKSLHSNISGAREAFANACETLFRRIYITSSVSQVRVKQGDGGVDIFVGELGVEPITVIQCKFFLDKFSESQKGQIRESFKSAINSEKFIVKEWVLCIPMIIDIDEHSWWFKWKNKQITQHNKALDFIALKNGNELIDLFKQHDLYDSVFKIQDSLRIEEIHKIFVPRPLTLVNNVSPKLVLFNHYSIKNRIYYLNRKIDEHFLESLKLGNIWISGKSGFGKTTLVNRNLIENSIDYCYCDLSPVEIKSENDVLEEILCIVEEKFEIERDSNEVNKIKQIVRVLCQANSKEFIIVIDELTVKDNIVLKRIANILLNLVVHFSNLSKKENLKFVVCTILHPRILIENKSKASEYFEYLNCDAWSFELDQLFDLINTTLELKLEKSKAFIVSSSGSSPRVLKSIFRKIITLNDTCSSSIEEAINLTLSEIIE